VWSVFELCSLNDLALIGNDKFYFTNDRKYCYYMETVFRVPFGSVGYYDGSHAELMVEDLFIPNGLALSNDKKYVVHIALPNKA